MLYIIIYSGHVFVDSIFFAAEDQKKERPQQLLTVLTS